jgi:hypothetical protein
LLLNLPLLLLHLPLLLLQLLFSSHHTLHDYPDDAGLLSLEGFLQICSVSDTQ